MGMMGPIIDFDQEEDARDVVYNALLPEDGIFKYTNLCTANLLDLYQSMQPFIADTGVWGPKCKLFMIDQLLCYLTWLKLSMEYNKVGVQFKIKKGRFQQNIDHIWLILNLTLHF